MADQKNQKPENEVQYMPIGLCLGLSLGVAFGSAMGNLGVGLCFGVGIGLCFGTAMDAFRKQKQENEQAEKSAETADKENDE